MGLNRIVFFALVLAIASLAEARFQARRLRDGEPCDMPGFFGDANDCRKFYRCAEHPTEDPNNPHLIRYSFRCPNGTVFDEALTTCNHPEAVMDKPENCQVYDPDEGEEGQQGMGGDGSGNRGSPWGVNKQYLFGGIPNQIVVQQQQQHHQQQQQPFIPFQQQQILYPSIAIPYGVFIHYG